MEEVDCSLYSLEESQPGVSWTIETDYSGEQQDSQNNLIFTDSDFFNLTDNQPQFLITPDSL